MNDHPFTSRLPLRIPAARAVSTLAQAHPGLTVECRLDPAAGDCYIFTDSRPEPNCHGVLNAMGIGWQDLEPCLQAERNKADTEVWISHACVEELMPPGMSDPRKVALELKRLFAPDYELISGTLDFQPRYNQNVRVQGYNFALRALTESPPTIEAKTLAVFREALSKKPAAPTKTAEESNAKAPVYYDLRWNPVLLRDALRELIPSLTVPAGVVHAALGICPPEHSQTR